MVAYGTIMDGLQLKPNSYYLDSGKEEHVKVDHVILAAKTYEWT